MDQEVIVLLNLVLSLTVFAADLLKQDYEMLEDARYELRLVNERIEKLDEEYRPIEAYKERFPQINAELEKELQQKKEDNDIALRSWRLRIDDLEKTIELRKAGKLPTEK